MKKYIIPVSVVAGIALLAILYFVFFSETNVYEAIPDSAVAVIEINDWSRFSNAFSTKASAAEWRNTEAVKRLENQVAFMQQLFAANTSVKSCLGKGKITVSAHLTSATDFDYLFTVRINTVANDDILKLLSARVDVASVIKRTFKERTIVDVTMKDGKRFSFTVIKQVLCFSFTSFLTENAVTALTGSGNLYDDKDLRKVKSHLNNNEDIATSVGQLFINFKKADIIFPVALKQQKLGLLSDITANRTWGGYAISLLDDRVNFTGASFAGNKQKHETSTQNILANTIWNSIPDNAAYVNAGFNNPEAEAGNMAKADFLPWVGEAHAFVTLEPWKEDFTDQNVFIIQVTDEQKAIEKLKHLISLDGSRAVATDTFMHNEIFNLKGGAVLNQVFGSSFTTFSNSFFCVSNHVAVFCNNADVLKFTLEKISKSETLNKDAVLRNAIGAVKTDETAVVYINPAKATLLFNGIVQEGSCLRVLLSKLNGICLQFAQSGEWQNTTASFITSGGGNKASQGLLWKTKLQAYSDFAPQILVNGNNGEQEIFIQDTANNVYLLNKAGDIIFTKNTGQKIIGGVSQLDYYGDGNKQFIFNTASNVYMLDRSGNNAASYPLRLSSTAVGGLTLVANGNQYRYYVPCANGAIYGYEATGRPLPGWSPRNNVGVITRPLLSFKNKNNQFLLAFNNAGKLMLLDNKGVIKWSIDNLPLTNQTFSVVQTAGDFTVLNAAGNQLIEISADGNDNIKPLIDSATSFAAVATSDTSYLYYYASPHDIRAYSDKGAFKNAVSLQASLIGGLQVLNIGDAAYLLVKDETMKRILVYSLALEPVAEYAVTNTTDFVITDLFGRKELIAIQPDDNGNVQCFRIK